MTFVNEAVWDRVVRVSVGLTLLYLGWAGTVEGGWGTFLQVFGFLPLATGSSGWCPAYSLLKFSTNGKIYKRAEAL